MSRLRCLMGGSGLTLAGVKLLGDTAGSDLAALSGERHVAEGNTLGEDVSNLELGHGGGM